MGDNTRAASNRDREESSILVEYGRPFQPKYYPKRLNRLCYVCGSHLDGKYYSHQWGDLCASHLGDPRCYSCSIVISNSGGERLDDGRAFCQGCHRTAVTGCAQRKVLNRIARIFMGKLGFALGAEVLVQLGNHPDIPDHCVGVTKGVVRNDEFGREVRDVQGIAILSHLPAVQFQSVLIHEYYHVWEIRRRLISSPRTSEGMAELCSWLYLESLQADVQVKRLMKDIEQQTDDIYGEGFRWARQSLNRYGFTGLMGRVLHAGGL